MTIFVNKHHLADCRSSAGVDLLYVDPEYDSSFGVFPAFFDQDDAVGGGEAFFYL